MKLKNHFDSEIILKLLRFLSKKEMQQIKLGLSQIDYTVKKSEIDSNLDKGIANKIIHLLYKKKVLTDKLEYKGETYYNLNWHNFYDFYNDITNQVLQKEQFRIQEKQTRIMWVNLVFAGLLIMVTFFLGWASFQISTIQINIAANQLELAKIVASSYEPKLRIWPEARVPYLATDRLLKEKMFSEKISVCIKNVGHTDSGLIQASWQANWTAQSNAFVIYPGLEPGQVNCSYLEIAAIQNPISNNKAKNDVKKKIPEGWTNLTLDIWCKYCVPDTFLQMFEVCVYRKTIKECSG